MSKTKKSSSMLKTAKLTGAAALLSVATASVGSAAAWDPASNPNYFNRPFNPTSYTYNLSSLPTGGVLSKQATPWSDSYWPKQRGSFSYRWRQFQDANINQTLSGAERKENFFSYHMYSKDELRSMAMTEEGRQAINMISPREKYSIYIGDYGYSLAKKYLNGRGNGPDRVSWEGYCHAWAPAATHYSEPAPTTVINPDNIPISFGSGDVKALLVANYHEQMFPGFLGGPAAKKSYIGGSGCNTGISFLYPTTKVRNGMIEMADYADTDGVMDTDLEANVRSYQAGLKQVLAQNPNSITLPFNAAQIANDSGLPAKARAASQTPGCMGVNAGTFHIVMANQLGIMKTGFEFDKTRDGQIWNQPARGYTTQILGYQAPSYTSAPGTVRVAKVKSSIQYADDTDYGWTYWNPTLKGLFGPVDSAFGAEYATYARMLVNQGISTEMPQYPSKVMDTANYVYTLDLDANGNIIGGDWLTLDRPDTLWIMERQGFKGNFEKLSEIYTPAQL
jgi:hypothetical protein